MIVAAVVALNMNFAEAGVHKVSQDGQLRVDGQQLVNDKGEPVQLRGASFGWHCLWPRFYNQSVVNEVVNNWGADIVRCSIGLNLEDRSFEKDPELGYACVDSIVQGAINNDAYVLVDFHSHPNNLSLAKEFFTEVGKKYGQNPNVLFEIWNEPMEVEWGECKAYAEELIPIIRQYAPNAVIIVPTPRWDQDVDKAAADPLVGFDNVMYSLHYYAATHQDDLRAKAQAALDAGLPLFMAECASMMHTGDGVIDPKSWEQWMQMANENNISWIAWSISDKDETCSMLRPSASSDANLWTQADLKPWAILLKYYLTLNR